MPDKVRADRRRAERVRIDGRLVATAPVEHGTYSTYGNWSCRCKPCSDAHKEEVARRRRVRMATRELIDGRFVASRAGQHGLVNTYNNWGCRCEPCTEAQAQYYARRHNA